MGCARHKPMHPGDERCSPPEARTQRSLGEEEQHGSGKPPFYSFVDPARLVHNLQGWQLAEVEISYGP